MGSKIDPVSEGNIKKTRRKKSKLDNVILKSIFSITIFFILFPMFFILVRYPYDVGNLLTGKVTESHLLVDSKAVIVIDNLEYFVNDFINISECGYSPSGGDVTCRFSHPFDNILGTWTPNNEDAGTYNVQINATNEFGELTTKNITLIILATDFKGGCNLSFNILDDHRIIVHWDNMLPRNENEFYEYNEFTISYVDYLVNGTFNDSDAVNITNINENFYLDNTANETIERYYKLYAHGGGINFECEDIFGKYTRDLTTSFGRWNYISSPFYRSDKSMLGFVDESKQDLEFAYKYDHSTGSFDFYFFDLNFGNIGDVGTNECLLLQPLRQTRITTAGRIMKNITGTFTTSFGRWNYFGWVAEYTDRIKAFAGFNDELEFLYIYDHDTGSFKFHFFDLNFGNINEISPTTCNVIQPYTPTTYEYNI